MSPTTPDTFPGPLEEEEIQLEERSTDPDLEGAIRYVSGSFKLKDNLGVFNPRSGGGGITESDHNSLDTLLHWLVETNYQEIVRTEGKVTSVINWVDSNKTTKIREMIITRTTGKVSQMVFIQYDGTGTEKHRITGVITRSAGKVTSIAWTRVDA